MIDYINAQLNAWARWRAAAIRKEVGFPSTSPMFKDIRHGEGYGSKPPQGIEIGSLDEIFDMDKAVMRLCEKDRALINEFYVRRGKSEEIAARVGVTKKRLYEMIHSLHQSLLGHLNDVVAGI